MNVRASIQFLATASLCALLSAGCSVKKLAINKLGDALAGGGQTFSSEDDPALVRDAAPFSLKLMETLLAENPHHQGLLLAAASGFTQYSFAFVHQEGDRLQDANLEASEREYDRARRLYLRARTYGLRGLDARHKGFGDALMRNPLAAVKVTTRQDVPLLYWTAAAWGAAISISKTDPGLIGDQVMVQALMDRALELDESWDQGAIHSFLIGYEMARQGAEGDPAQRARAHFARAMELSGGRLASPLVNLAEAVALQRQDRAEFESLLQRALTIDPDAAPTARLVNLIMQERARWLLSRIEDLFLSAKAE